MRPTVKGGWHSRSYTLYGWVRIGIPLPKKNKGMEKLAFPIKRSYLYIHQAHICQIVNIA